MLIYGFETSYSLFGKGSQQWEAAKSSLGTTVVNVVWEKMKKTIDFPKMIFDEFESMWGAYFKLYG